MKAFAKLFETMLTKDPMPTWGHQGNATQPHGAGPEQLWSWGG
jgi:hypothetical protein